MSSTGTVPVCDRMYSKLIDDEGTEDPFIHRADVGHSGHPVSPVMVVPMPSGPGSYRLATACLATLCVVLLISIIAVAAHHESKPRGDGEEISEVQKQKQDANVSSLMASVSRLQQEKDQLQKEKEELQAKLAATRAPEAMGPTTKATPAPIVCPVDWHLFKGSCYFISRTTRDWPESKSFCESQGGHLAIIHTAEEQTFLWDLLPRAHWNAFWFGITDEHTEDHWKWVDGTPLVGGFWEVGEPNNHIDEDCGYIVKTRVLERVAVRSWFDAPCSMYCRFICEKEMVAGASTAMPH